MTVNETPYGFKFGPALVERVAVFQRSNGDYHVIGIKTDHQSLAIYVSPTGKSVRVFSDHREMKVTS